MAKKAFNEWMRKRSGENAIKYIISCDINDPYLPTYRLAFNNQILVNSNRSIVDACNKAALQILKEKHTDYDMIVVMSDDFSCPQKWDKLLMNYAEGNKYAIHVQDTIQQTTMTLPIISVGVYKEYGYIYYKDYFSLFADNDITEWCDMKGYLKRVSLIFPHNHCINKKNKKDETYMRENSAQAYTIGKSVFERRKQSNFK